MNKKSNNRTLTEMHINTIQSRDVIITAKYIGTDAYSFHHYPNKTEQEIWANAH